MITVNTRNSRMWSLLGPWATFGNTLLELAKENEKIIVFAGDMAKTAGLERFGKTFPDKLINVGIAEQNMLAWQQDLRTKISFHLLCLLPIFPC